MATDEGRRPRRPKGTGSIYQRADGYWVMAIELPNYGGKRRTKRIVRANKADLTAAANKVRRDLAASGDLPDGAMSLAKWLDVWVADAAATRLAPRSAKGYRDCIRSYITPAIGNVRLDRLTPGHVDRLRHSIIDKKPAGKGLSTSTALKAHRILSRALKVAQSRGLITTNPCEPVDAPPVAYNPRPALEADETRAILMSLAPAPDDEAAVPHDEAAMAAVALLTGLREGEIAGMTTTSVMLDTDALARAKAARAAGLPPADPTFGIIRNEWQVQRLIWEHGCGGSCGHKRGGDCPKRHVVVPENRQAINLYGGLWLTPPKSKTGNRDVPICEPLALILEAYLAERAPGNHGLIFHRDDGHPIDPKTVNLAWHRVLERAKVRSVSLHSARHTANTLLAQLDVPVEVRQQIMGHSSAPVNRSYTHPTSVEAIEGMRALGELVGTQS